MTRQVDVSWFSHIFSHSWKFCILRDAAFTHVCSFFKDHSSRKKREGATCDIGQWVWVCRAWQMPFWWWRCPLKASRPSSWTRPICRKIRNICNWLEVVDGWNQAGGGLGLWMPKGCVPGHLWNHLLRCMWSILRTGRCAGPLRDLRRCSCLRDHKHQRSHRWWFLCLHPNGVQSNYTYSNKQIFDGRQPCKQRPVAVWLVAMSAAQRTLGLGVFEGTGLQLGIGVLPFLSSGARTPNLSLVVMNHNSF